MFTCTRRLQSQPFDDVDHGSSLLRGLEREGRLSSVANHPLGAAAHSPIDASWLASLTPDSNSLTLRNGASDCKIDLDLVGVVELRAARSQAQAVMLAPAHHRPSKRCKRPALLARFGSLRKERLHWRPMRWRPLGRRWPTQLQWGNRHSVISSFCQRPPAKGMPALMNEFCHFVISSGTERHM